MHKRVHSHVHSTAIIIIFISVINFSCLSAISFYFFNSFSRFLFFYVSSYIISWLLYSYYYFLLCISTCHQFFFSLSPSLLFFFFQETRAWAFLYPLWHTLVHQLTTVRMTISSVLLVKCYCVLLINHIWILELILIFYLPSLPLILMLLLF